MMLSLSSGDNQVGQMELPMPLDEMNRRIEKICVESQTNRSLIRIFNVESPIRGMGWYLRPTKLDNDEALEKLNQLADALGRMDTEKLHHLSRALAECGQGLDEVLQAASHIERSVPASYEFIPNIARDQDLGRWLVDHDRLDEKAPESLRPYLNYDWIGREYREAHDGVYLTNGYAGIQTGALEQVIEEQSVFQATLSANQNTFRLCFPASEEQLEQAKGQLGVDDFCRVDVLNIRAQDRMSSLMEMLPAGLVTVEELDALADCIQRMEREDGNILKYCSALEVETPTTFSEAVTIAMDIDDYERVPEDMDEYGKQVLRRAGANDEVIDTIDGYMDFAQLGEDSMAEDGIRRTEFGLVRRISTPFPSEDMGQTMS